jgi:hypothetical protein
MDLSEVVDISWAQFDQYVAAVAAAPARAAAAAPAGEAEHACGYSCPHVCADDAGSYVCRLTGRVFGHQARGASVPPRRRG